ncbi:hypothetical protein CCUS01_12085, partial [Colletotrichum cuscutae]
SGEDGEVRSNSIERAVSDAARIAVQTGVHGRYLSMIRGPDSSGPGRMRELEFVAKCERARLA